MHARPFDRHETSTSLLIPWCKPPSRKSREILLPPSVARHQVRPIKAERRAALLKIHRARPGMAGRDRLRRCAECRTNRCAPQMQRSSRQHDDLNGVHRPRPRQGRRRRSAAPRHWRRWLARCAGRMVASVRTAWADRAIKGWVLVDVQLRKPNHPFSFSPLPKRRPIRQERDFSGRRPSPQNGLVRRQERRNRPVK